MAFTLSPNMSLPVPSVGNEAGPQYALDVNSCMAIIDQHTHQPGSGVQITPAGLNINTALTMQGNFLINTAGVTFTAQSSAPANNTIYESGVDLYYVDGVGNNVRITQSGGVAGSPGSISNLVPPASAAYVSGSSTFVWQSNTSVAANMDFGSAVFRNLTPNSTFGVTLQSPAALSSNYTLTLPTIPVTTSIMTLSSSGVMAGAYTLDNSTIIVSSNVIEVAPGGITSTQIAAGTIQGSNIGSSTVTRQNIVDPGVQMSASCGTGYANSSSSATLVTNLSVTITTTGKPIMIWLQDDGNGGIFQATSISDHGTVFSYGIGLQLLRGSIIIAIPQYNDYFQGDGAASNYQATATWAGQLYYVDIIGAGTQTYTVKAYCPNSTTALVQVQSLKLCAVEMY